MTEEVRGLERIGTIIRGKYRLDRLLGTGGMAAVYEATHRNKKRFAVKILFPELSRRADICARFLKEGYVANTVDHPGAVSVLDDDVTEDGAAFLVMELLEGAVVEALFEEHGKQLPLRAVLAIAHQLLDILVAAHAKGVIHRDLKPANLFLLRDGTLKVLDFGIARIRDAAQEASATSTGTMLGTPAFMPPEQANAKASEIDARSDLWAVGATMFTLLSGELVHVGDNSMQIVIAAATQKPRALTSLVRDTPAPVAAIVDRALAFEKAERWPSAAEMQSAIALAYETIFREPVARSALADLVTSVERAPAPPLALQATTPSVDSLDAPHSSTLLSGPSPAPLHGTTTVQPVSSGRRTAARRSSQKLVLGGIAMLGVSIAIAATYVRSHPPPLASATPVSSQPLPSNVPAVSLTPLPSASAPPPQTSASSSTVPTISARPHPVPVKNNCDPPYFIDDTGKHFKPECL